MQAEDAAVSDAQRKKFSPRSMAFDDFRRKQISAFGGRAIPTDEHLMVLEDHVSVSLRRRSNAYPLFKLQMALLMDLVDAKRPSRHVRASSKNSKPRRSGQRIHPTSRQ